MAFRCGSLREWQGFDERLGHGTFVQGWADRHVLFSLIKLGHSVVYTPNAVVSHPFPDSPAAIRKRFIVDRSALAGYLTLLFMEEREHRNEVLRFAFGRLRTLTAGHQHRIVPLWREVLACLSGPFLYTRSVLAHRSSANDRR